MESEITSSLYRVLLDATRDWETLSDSAGNIIYSSPAGERITGLSTEVILRGISRYYSLIHPEDLLIVKQHEKLGVDGHVVGEVRYRLRGSDGEYKWLHHICGPLYDVSGNYLGQRGSTREITDIKLLEHRIDMLLALTALSSDLISLGMTDIGHGIRKALASIGSLTEADIALVFEFTDDPVVQRVVHRWDASRSDADRADSSPRTGHASNPGEPPTLAEMRGSWCCARLRERELVRWDKVEPLPSEAEAELVFAQRHAIDAALLFPYIRANEVIGSVAVFSRSGPREWSQESIIFLHIAADLLSALVQRGRREQMLHRQHEDLQSAHAAFETAVRAKDEFLSVMSHELRTPLTTMLGVIELIRMQPALPAEKLRRYTDTLAENAHRLAALIDDLFHIVGIRTRTDMIAKADVEVRSLLAHVVDGLLGGEHPVHRHIEWSVDPPDLRFSVDRTSIRHMLDHLLKNAVKFTPDDGSITVHAAPEDATGMIRIEVRDTGIGIAEAERDRIFTPFLQLDTGTKRAAGGAGIGLTIVRNIAEIHGGSVSVHETPGGGATFVVLLPQA